jgi:hypothetical protein
MAVGESRSLDKDEEVPLLPEDIHTRANQFHAHPNHHLLTCLDEDNQWFWSHHLAHVSHASGQICGQGMRKFGSVIIRPTIPSPNPAR